MHEDRPSSWRFLVENALVILVAERAALLSRFTLSN